MLTGWGDHTVDVTAMKAGAADYLDKSQLSVQLLERSIRYAIERRRAEEALRESERRLKEAQAMGRIGDWKFDVDNQKITWPDQVFKLYERDPGLGAPTAEEEAT